MKHTHTQRVSTKCTDAQIDHFRTVYEKVHGEVIMRDEACEMLDGLIFLVALAEGVPHPIVDAMRSMEEQRRSRKSKSHGTRRSAP